MAVQVSFFTPEMVHLMPTVDAVKFLELLWARCGETRLGVHFAALQEDIKEVINAHSKEGKETKCVFCELYCHHNTNSC
jgi:hypothetical protein